MRIYRRILMAACMLTAAVPVRAEDTRQWVKMPEKMQEHMLANMRDHLTAMGEIQTALANGKYNQAAEIAEQRIGMSSLQSHGASHMATYMPKAMQDIGTNMHRAASRLVIVLQDASVAPTAEAMRDISRALHAVTTACEACHAGYRVR